MTEEQPENTELEHVYLIDCKIGQINGMLAIIVNQETLCSVETH